MTLLPPLPAPRDWRKDYWLDGETNTEHAERVEHAEKVALKLFIGATKHQLQHWRDTIIVIEPYRGSPRWERLRDAAWVKYQDTTREAQELFAITAEEVMREGVVSDDTSARWDMLDVMQAIRDAMGEVAA